MQPPSPGVAEDPGHMFPMLEQECGSSELLVILCEEAGGALAHHLPCMQQTPSTVPKAESVAPTTPVLGEPSWGLG